MNSNDIFLATCAKSPQEIPAPGLFLLSDGSGVVLSSTLTCLLWRQAHQLEDCFGVTPAPLPARLNRHIALNMAAPREEEEDELLLLLVGPCDKSLPTRPQNPLVHAALPQLTLLPHTSTSAIALHHDSRQVQCTSKSIPGDSSATCASGTADISVITGIPGDQGSSGVSEVQAGLGPQSFSHNTSNIDAFGFLWGQHYRQCSDLGCTGCVIAGLEHLDAETDAMLMPAPVWKRQRK